MRVTKSQVIEGICLLCILFILACILRLDVDTNEYYVQTVFPVQGTSTIDDTGKHIKTPELSVRKLANEYLQYVAGDDYPVIYSKENIEHILTDAFYETILLTIPVDEYYLWQTTGNTVSLISYITRNTYKITFDGILIEIIKPDDERSNYGRYY